MNIAVCEDRKEEADWLCDIIRLWSIQNKIDAEITSFENAASFSFALEDHSFDALFLDIKMPGENGVALAKRLRQQAYDMSIVFVTGEKEYIMEGYEVDAIHYLLKPVDRQTIYHCLDRIYEKNQQQEPFLLLQTEDNTTVKLLQREIYMIEVFSHKLEYATTRGSFQTLSSMKEIQGKLIPDWFVSCHRGILINLLHVDSIEKNHLILADEKNDFYRKVPVSRRLYTSVNEAFIHFYKQEFSKLIINHSKSDAP